MTYNLKSLKLPKLSGTTLKAFTIAVENSLGRMLLINSLLENGGIPKLRRISIQEVPTMFPLVQLDGNKTEEIHLYPILSLRIFPFSQYEAMQKLCERETWTRLMWQKKFWQLSMPIISRAPR